MIQKKIIFKFLVPKLISYCKISLLLSLTFFLHFSVCFSWAKRRLEKFSERLLAKIQAPAEKYSGIYNGLKLI